MSEPSEDTASHRYAYAAEQVMKKQAALGIQVAAVFIILIVGLPLLNFYFPAVAATPVMGFSLTWLILGVAFFPISWLLSAYFVRESDKIEADVVRAALAADAAAVADDAGRSAVPPADKDAK